MTTGHARTLGATFVVIDGAAAVAAYAAAEAVVGRATPVGHYVTLAAACLVIFFVLFLSGFQRQDERSRANEFVRIVRTVALLVVVLALAEFRRTSADWTVLAIFAPLCTGAMVGGRALARILVSAALPRRRVIVAGNRDEVKQVTVALDQSGRGWVEIAGVVCDDVACDNNDDDESPERVGPYRLLGRTADLPSLARAHLVDEVIIVPAPQSAAPWLDLEPVLLQFEELGIVVRLVMNFLPKSLSAVSFERMNGLHLLTFSMVPRREGLLLVRRWVDATQAFGLLTLLSPLLLLSALAIKVSSPGPVLFKQTRCGLHGRPFTFLKLRSMWVGAESQKPALARYNEMSGPAFKMTRDPRITPIGQLLRRTSLDELPQLWNILRGDMSFVGPRPAVVEEVAQYQAWQRRRLSMRPGLTCLWQISGRNEVGFDEWIRLDLEYIDNWSPWLDLEIALKTIPAVLMGRGAR